MEVHVPLPSWAGSELPSETAGCIIIELTSAVHFSILHVGTHQLASDFLRFYPVPIITPKCHWNPSIRQVGRKAVASHTFCNKMLVILCIKAVLRGSFGQRSLDPSEFVQAVL